MTRRSACALLALGSFLLLLTACAPGRTPSQVAVGATSTPTAAPPAPTPVPQKATPTPNPPTATPLPPTAAPTTTPHAPEIAAPAGWNAYDKSAVGFTFALPPQWEVADLDQEDADELIERMQREIPEMSNFGASTGDLLAGGIKLVACDCMEAAQSGTIPASMNVIVQPLPQAVPFDLMVRQAIKALEAMPFTVKPVKHTRIPHPSADAEAIQYRMRTTEGRTVTATQYVLANEHRLIIVTITASIAKAEQLTPTFYKIIQTFRLTAYKSQQM
ncbi:MAG TPA: hypothetical protein VFZ66_03690 [Herpetosiphonaceae bacterium]